MTTEHTQWIRKVGLSLFNDEKLIDLSEFHIKFHVSAAATETPNSASIRIYNLSDSTIVNVKEFSRVVLQAGYENGNYGVIFVGVVKQIRQGRENATDKFIELLASDGDDFYSQGFVVDNVTREASDPNRVLHKVVDAGSSSSGSNLKLDSTNLKVTSQYVPGLRGAVLFGMARDIMRLYAKTLDAGWSIQHGEVQLIDNSGYDENTAVKINVATGLIGIPEQTSGGIEVTCLLNSRIRVSGLVTLNNEEIRQLIQKTDAAIGFNSYQLVENAPLSKDGNYMAFAINHEGDTRGQVWYSHLTCLALDISLTNQNKAVNIEGT